MKVKVEPFYRTEVSISRVAKEIREGISRNAPFTIERRDLSSLIREMEGTIENPEGKLVSYFLGTDFSGYSSFKMFIKKFGLYQLVTVAEKTYPTPGISRIRRDIMEQTAPREQSHQNGEPLMDLARNIVERQKREYYYFEPITDDEWHDVLTKTQENEGLYEIFLSILHKRTSEILKRFQEDLRGLMGEIDKHEIEVNAKDYVLRFLQEALEYEIEVFKEEDDGDSWFILTGKDLRANILLALAEYLRTRNNLPEPAYLVCRVCGEEIDPKRYDSFSYCSRKCASLGSKRKRHELYKLKDRVKKKAGRKLNPRRLEAFLTDLDNRATKRMGEEGIRRVCRKYGINPDPEKGGRPPKINRPHPASGGSRGKGRRGR